MKSKVIACVLMALGLVAMGAGDSAAHEDPGGCSVTNASLTINTYRANGTTGVTSVVSECETINYQARLAKAADVSTICAFSGGLGFGPCPPSKTTP